MEVEFCIDLVLGSTFISKGTYRLAPAELKELKTQQTSFRERIHKTKCVPMMGLRTLYKGGWDLKVVHGL